MQVPNIAAAAKRFCIRVYSPQGEHILTYDDARHLNAVPEIKLIMFEDSEKTPHSFQGFLYHVTEILTPGEESSEPTSKLIVGG